jgi:TRAP-type C4-dicarboxylate transport system substrate-binding protein
MRRHRIFSIAWLVVIILFGTTLQGAAQPLSSKNLPKEQVWRYSNFLPPHHFSQWCISWFLDEIEKRTGGRIKTKLFIGEALGKAAEHYSMVISGRVEMGQMITGFAPGVFPLSSVLQLPFTWNTALEGSLVANDLFRKGFLDETLRKDVKIMALNLTVPLKIWTKKPVSGLEGLKGLRLRVAGGLDTQTVDALGAAPVSMPLPEVFPALEKGVLDGGLYSFESAAIFKYAEAAKYVMDVPAGYAVGMFIMNKKTWNSLPKETQAVLDDLFRYIEVHWGETYDLLENRYKKDIIKQYSVIVADISPGEIEKMKAATVRVKDDWIADMKKKGLPGQENYDALITSMKNFGIMLDQTWVKNRALAK